MGFYGHLGFEVSRLKIEHRDSISNTGNDIKKSQFFTGVIPGVGLFMKPHEKVLISLEWRTAFYQNKTFN